MSLKLKPSIYPMSHREYLEAPLSFRRRMGQLLIFKSRYELSSHKFVIFRVRLDGIHDRHLNITDFFIYTVHKGGSRISKLRKKPLDSMVYAKIFNVSFKILIVHELYSGCPMRIWLALSKFLFNLGVYKIGLLSSTRERFLGVIYSKF